MSHRAISVTIVKLFAIGLIIFTFQNAGSALFFMTSDASFGTPTWAEIYLIATAIAIPAIAACILWARPSTVISSSVGAQAGETEQNLDAPGILSVGLGLIGVYFIAASLGFIFEWLLLHFFRKQELPEYGVLGFDHYYPLYSEVGWLLIGLALFFGASGIQKAFYAVRNFGLTTGDRPGRTPVDGG